MDTSSPSKYRTHELSDGELILFLYDVRTRIENGPEAMEPHLGKGENPDVYQKHFFWGAFGDDEDEESTRIHEKADEHLWDCLRLGIISSLRVERLRAVSGYGTGGLFDKKFIYTPEIVRDRDLNWLMEPNHRSEMSELANAGESYQYAYFMVFDDVACDAYIESYLTEWLEDHLTSMLQNFLRAEKQVERFLITIKDLVENYAHHNLSVEVKPSREMQFTTVLFFLEKIGLIRIIAHMPIELSIDGSRDEFSFSLTDDFFEMIAYVKGKPIFIWEALKRAFYEAKNMDDLILFKKPNGLFYRDRTMQLHAGFRLNLLGLAKKTMPVDTSALGFDVRLEANRKKLDKALWNFKRDLCKQLNFSTDVKLFSQKNGQIFVSGFRFK